MASKNKPPPEIKEVFNYQISDKISSVRVHPHDRKLVGIAALENVAILGPEGIRETMNCGNNPRSFCDISWDSKGVLLSSVSSQGVLYVWDTREKTCPKGVRGPSTCQLSVQFNPINDQELVTTGMDEYLYLWDLRKLGNPRKMRAALEPICCAGYQAGGSRIACGSLQGNVRVFKVSDGNLESHLCVEQESAILDLKIAPMIDYILVSSQDGKLRLCNFKELQGRQIKSFVGHECNGFISRCSFLGANYVMSTSDDGRVVVWYLNKSKVVAQELQCYTQNDNDNSNKHVMGLDEVTSKGYFVTGCIDGTVKAWQSTNT
eukprot:TRINITY_DN1154_c0_g2_i10.p2 TRINITY_DN1154_c0_g2~~TRINITY_DN1154_c0_g2_i10.p2  ORF type:complete len:319 (-),score=35.32 TRINITY_DN1154_c0_g2_i10:553-1509(-)